MRKDDYSQEDITLEFALTIQDDSSENDEDEIERYVKAKLVISNEESVLQWRKKWSINYPTLDVLAGSLLMARIQEDYRTLNPLFPCSDPIPVVSTLKKNVFILFGVLIGLLLLSTIVLAILFSIEKSKTISIKAVEDNLCVTPFCIKAANYLLESIDEGVQPCEDFFQFACGTWLKNNRIPDDTGAQDTFNVLRTQLDNNVVDILTSELPKDSIKIKAIANARLLYNACVNESAIETAGVDTILSVLENELGGWPIVNGLSWDEKNFNLSNLLLKLREYNNNIIFNCGTSTDDRNSSAYFIRVRKEKK
ncbi:unnamed protein product [Rotaria magnacalcarata]|uniref:Peptidase M13 N-terminal domain-containing protein n=1 Tax=Rotaria magnacalcarata TaxID=392030 RepID=A0A8S2NFC1_9BILA|nr:unnamed protein product [Rotaria magnacalcarata]